MPQQSYTVTFPDGYKSTFQAERGMSDEDLVARAKQERDISAGRIQTTKAGGFTKALGEDQQTTGALLNAVGMVPGLTPLSMLSAPIARGIQYGTQKLTGQNPQAPDTAELLGLAGKTAVGMVPLAANNAAQGAAARVLAHQVPNAAMQGGKQWVSTLDGGPLAWGIREGASAAGQAAGKYLQPWAKYAPAVRDALMQLMNPSQQTGPQP